MGVPWKILSYSSRVVCLVIFVSILQLSNSFNYEFPCFQCICETLSGECSTDGTCETDRDGTEICGAYRISENYAQAVLQPLMMTTNFKIDFRDCANRLNCSELLIRMYINRFQDDCFKNREIDCRDVFRLHVMGPERCTERNTNTRQWKQFLNCLQLPEPATENALESALIEIIRPTSQFNQKPIRNPSNNWQRSTTLRTTRTTKRNFWSRPTRSPVIPIRIIETSKPFDPKTDDDDGYYGRK
jgi:hypothetical protein